MSKVVWRMATSATSVARVRGGLIGVVLLFAALYFVQGMNETATGLVHQPVYSLLKKWGTNPGRMTTLVALLGWPWCCKPLFGLLTDFLPLAGYRRKSYLVAMGFLTSICFCGLYALMPLQPGSRMFLMLTLMVPTFAVTFADVVLDALIIETGQPRGITARLQSVRWGASYAATIFTGQLGGKLCQQRHEDWAFLICGALAAVALVLTVICVREPRKAAVEDDLPTIRSTFSQALRSPMVWWVGAFLFVWHFNPFTQSVLYLHMTKTRHMSDAFYGDTISLLAVGSIAACATYGVYCRKVPMRWMVPLAIVCGVISTLSYWFLEGRTSAMIISLVVGFTYMTANMIQCDLAAQACPLHAAGTIFGGFMALCNISTLLATSGGGFCYEWAVGWWGVEWGFKTLLVLGAIFTLLAWPVARRIPRNVFFQ
ncbi:MAG TPA: MFS transporter [Pirellulales bacterium]|nr:MFS transporter [Pirellulales bacterium]